jgi:serine/threonine protein kinase
MSAGTRLGRYEIVSDLGAGGMATVYLGRALSVAGFQRLVAIKLLHPHLLRDETFVQMFLDEGRLAARIHHPNVVGTLDLERSPEGLYIVSEYIEGDQLLGLYKAARATEQRIPRPIALRIALDVLAGLQAAHDLTDDLGTALRIVHRDVSPHNILVGSDGITRLTDFGIAKAEERIADTRDGIVKGKLSYMAPEQPNDSPIDRRADLFSLGTVLWECLTGRRLFPGKTDAEVLQALLYRPIARLRAVDPELPEALDGVLARALDRDPARRWQSAREFSDALEGAVGASGIASYRVVADHVKQVAAPKIIAEHERRRATTRDLPVYRPSAESLRAISAIPSPGRASSPPAPPTQLPSVASADEAPTQMQSAMMPPTMPTARGLAPPPGPGAKMVTAGPEATTVRPPSDHRASGARLLPPLPQLPHATPATPASPVPPAPEAAAGDVDDEALAPTLISSPRLNAAAAAARAADIAPAPEPVFALMPRAMSVAPPPPVAPRQAQRSSRGFGWLVVGVVMLGASLGVVIWKVGVAGESVEYARPVASRPAAPVITPPPLEPAAPPEPPAVAMQSAPLPPVEPAVAAPPPVVHAPVVHAPVVRAPVVRAPVVRAPVVRAPVVRAPVAAPTPPPPVAPPAPSVPQLPTSI